MDETPLWEEGDSRTAKARRPEFVALRCCDAVCAPVGDHHFVNCFCLLGCERHGFFCINVVVKRLWTGRMGEGHTICCGVGCGVFNYPQRLWTSPTESYLREYRMAVMLSSARLTYALLGQLWLAGSSVRSAANASTMSVCDVMTMTATGCQLIGCGY